MEVNVDGCWCAGVYGQVKQGGVEIIIKVRVN